MSTLSAWGPVLAGQFAARVDAAMVQRGKRAAKIATLLADLGGDYARQITEVEDASQNLRQAFLSRWGTTTIKRYDRAEAPQVNLLATASNHQGAVSVSDAVRNMQSLATSLPRWSMPILASTRALRFDAEFPQVFAALAHGAAAQRRILGDLRSRVVQAAPSIHRAIPGEEAAIARLNRTLVLGAGIGEGIDAGLDSVTPGYGSLVLQSGWLVDTGPEVMAYGPDTQWIGSTSPQAEGVAAAASPLFIPAMLDLEEDGGLITDSRPAINSLVLRLLALLPPGELKLNVFDPQRLGDSVKYVFDLGESATKVIGDKVRSTSRELHELLDSVEAHLTFVTQKYLAAQHKTLHEYNIAAGEVAEPYRVLLLFDYPHGFERAGGGVDHDAVAQLEKIIKAGPRCGVYTLVVSERGGPAGLPRLDKQAFGGPNWPIRARELAQRRVQETSLASSDVDGLVAAVGSSGKAVNFQTHSKLAWVPIDASQMSSAPVKRLTTRIEKGLHDAAAVEVSAQRVSQLAKTERDERLRKQIPAGPPVADPDDTSTWWKGDSAEGVVARVGRMGSSAVAEIKISSSSDASHALVGGATGSGKSVFLHALITDLSRTYSPDQLELHLVDLKMGVEFKAYVSLPHARVVALEAGRDFGVATLQGLVDKMEKRGAIFKQHGVSEIAEYRRVATRPMPRVVAVIDEFQGLFELDDVIGDQAATLLRQLLKKGRAMGIHMVLASQTIGGAPALPRDVLGQIPVRVVFASVDTDARLLLADDNPEAVLLNRSGEGIRNTSAGRKNANERFQGAFVTRQDAHAMATRVRDHAVAHGATHRPKIFDGIHEQPVTPRIWTALTTPRPDLSVPIGLGLPMNLGEAVTANLERAQGGNLLVVGPASRTVPVLLLATAAAKSGATDVQLLDFAGLGSEFSTAVEPALATRLALPIVAFHGRHLEQALIDAAELVDQRQSARQYRERTLVLVLANLERAPQLDSGAAADALARVLDEGPSVGVHVVASLDKASLVDRRLGYDGLDKFDNRATAALGRDDSNRILDDSAAESLPAEQLAFHNRASARSTVVRAFSTLDPTRWG